MRLSQNERTGLVQAIAATKAHLATLEFVLGHHVSLPEEAGNAMVGHATRQIAECMNALRNEFAFEDVGEDEVRDIVALGEPAVAEFKS